MKHLLTLLFSGALLIGSAGFTLAQNHDNSVKETTKDVGRDTKRAAKATGKTVKKTTKKVVHKGAKVTRKGAEKVEGKTEVNK